LHKFLPDLARRAHDSFCDGEDCITARNDDGTETRDELALRNHHVVDYSFVVHNQKEHRIA
jgi:hypothetical protein